MALACLAVLSLSLSSSRPSAAAGDAAPTLLARVIDLTNAERQKAGLAPLVPNSTLSVAAQEYTGVLAAGDCFAHSCGPVPDLGQRAVGAGYTGWSALAENIAGGQTTPEAVMAAWMASPGHRANILNPAYAEIGVGTSSGGKYGIYWAQEFGARRTQAALPLPSGSAPATAPAPAAIPPTPGAAPAAVEAASITPADDAEPSAEDLAA